MASVNKTILIGNITKDPDTSYVPSGMCVCKFSLATNEMRKDKNGDKKESVQYHRITAFGKLGEICGEYLVKGKQVYIEGRISYGSYEKDGITRYTADIIAKTMQMLGNSGGGQREEPEPDLPPQYVPGEEEDVPF